MTKACLTCENVSTNKKLYNNNNIISKTKNVVPFWYKEIGNYSHLPPPLNCESKYNRFKNKFTVQKVQGNPKLTIKLDLKDLLGNKTSLPKWVYFWAAKQRNYNTIQYPYAPDAYDQFQNSGLVKTNKKGLVTLKLNNPEIYQVNGKVYSPHVHFTYLKDDKTWEIDAYTVSIVPKISLSTFKQLISSKKYIVLNAIPLSKKPQLIKGTNLLPFDTTTDIDTFIQTLRNKNKKLENSSLKNKEIPIVIYCKNKDCDASNRLIKRLRSLNYVNLIYFQGGLDEYNKK